MGHNDSRHEDPRGGWRDGLRATVDVGVRAAGARQLRAVLINAAILTLALAGFAVAQNADGGGKAHSAASRRAGDAVELGRRNPSSGSVPAETAIVANSGNSGFALRLTNNAPGGRANSSTCTNDATDPTAGCHVYVNKGKGIVASFRSAGSGVAPFAVRNTNDGMVASLNSQFVNNNQVACPERDPARRWHLRGDRASPERRPGAIHRGVQRVPRRRTAAPEQRRVGAHRTGADRTRVRDR